MNPLKKIRGWCERRHWVVKGIGIILLLFICFALLAMMLPPYLGGVLYWYVPSGPIVILIPISYLIIGYIILLWWWEFQKRNKRVGEILLALLIIPSILQFALAVFAIGLIGAFLFIPFFALGLIGWTGIAQTVFFGVWLAIVFVAVFTVRKWIARKKTKELRKEVLETLVFILAIPFIGLLYLIWAIFGWATKFLDDILDKPKELLAIMLLTYGVAALYLANYSGLLPPLYLPPNLAIIAIFLGVGGPITLVCCLVIHSKMKKRKEAARELDFKSMHAFDAAYEYGETLQSQLTELKEQLGRGVITQEEYEEKKKKLLEKSET